ncbi:MAG: DUF3667 domain-containing protein [Myroides sp.]|nr:DUF3667 domain-containing protein [Myroides sp.]
MEHTHCLNCGSDLTGKFCVNCGQKSDTHRITLKHLIFHDIIHGTFHFEKGMLFTAKQALFRPGKAALDYISGKRVNYYNMFYFILISIGITALLYHSLSTDGTVKPGDEMNTAGEKIDHIFTTYGKFLIFSIVPLTALNSYIIFKRKKLNFSEHVIISGMLLLGIFLMLILLLSLASLETFITSTKLSTYLFLSFPFIMLFYIVYVYHNAFRQNYTRLGFSYRAALFIILLLFELTIFLTLLLGTATNWEGGEIIY